jgi:hypothetical protein
MTSPNGLLNRGRELLYDIHHNIKPAKDTKKGRGGTEIPPPFLFWRSWLVADSGQSGA